jgi:hypothetical protein
MTFKSSEAYVFLKANHGGKKILDSFLMKSSDYSENSTQLEVCSLKYPYKEFAWLISRIMGQETMTTTQDMYCISCTSTMFMRASCLIGLKLFQARFLSSL